jgi:hypothetical protein
MAASGCSGAHGPRGYGYAGHEAAYGARGVRATVTPLVRPRVRRGHVAGWVGVGGRGTAPGGRDQWLQVGLAWVPGSPLLLYVEVTRPGRQPELRLLGPTGAAGAARRLAVLEVTGRPGWWRAWVDGRPVTEPIRLAGPAGQLHPIATAESWDGGAGACNAFAFRFEDVVLLASVWRPFAPGRSFRDAGFTLRRVAHSTGEGRFGFVASARR